MPRSAPETVDAYLAAQSPESRPILESVRVTIRRALPRATERISYRIPTYDIDGRMILFFAGFARHWSIYPVTPALLRELGAELTPRLKGETIRFSYEERFPSSLVTRIAKIRAAETLERLLPTKRQRKERCAGERSRKTSAR